MSQKTNALEVRTLIESYGCKMLSEYKSANERLLISCKCGNVRETSFANFKMARHKICKQCSVGERAQKRRFGIEHVKQFFVQHGCELLNDKYKNANQVLSIKCKCGEIWNADFHTFKRSKHKACKICSSAAGGKLIAGEKNSQFGLRGKLNPNFNSKKRNIYAREMLSPKFLITRQQVLERDNNTCKKCGFNAKFKTEKRSLNIHHLFNKMEYPQWFYRVSNLITLCGNCHKSFHKFFGFRNNNPSQMKIYLGNKWQQLEKN